MLHHFATEFIAAVCHMQKRGHLLNECLTALRQTGENQGIKTHQLQYTDQESSSTLEGTRVRVS
jgi:hypothetical protein